MKHRPMAFDTDSDTRTLWLLLGGLIAALLVVVWAAPLLLESPAPPKGSAVATALSLG